MAPYNPRFRHIPPPLIGEIARYFAAGLLSYGLGISLAALFKEVIHLPEEISVAVSLLILIVTNFFISRKVVFRSTGQPITQFIRFAATATVMRGAEYLLFLVFLRGFDLNYLVALTVAMVMSNCAKFVIYRSVVFSRPGNVD